MKIFISIFLSLLTTYSFAQEHKYILHLSPDHSVIKTPKGHYLHIQRNESHYYLQWQIGNSLKTLDFEFDSNAPDAWQPYLIKENDDFLVIRAGCGNPCWKGFFLPLKSSQKLRIINEYYGFDLNSGYVAYSNDKEQLEVLNLKSGKSQLLNIGNCDSPFMGYCLDTIYFKKHYLFIKWNSDADFDLRKAKVFLIRLKI